MCRIDGDRRADEESGGDVYLAVKGSGQSLYVGFTPSGYLVASEIYGLVGQTQRYVRVDGTPGGTVLRLRREGAGGPEAVERCDATGTALTPIEDPLVSEVTSRDLALGAYEHYLEKELNDAPCEGASPSGGRSRPSHCPMPRCRARSGRGSATGSSAPSSSGRAPSPPRASRT